MYNQERCKLEEEINYWKNLISSHKSLKSSKQYMKRKTNSLSKQFVWNNQRFNQSSLGQKYKNTNPTLRAVNFHSTIAANSFSHPSILTTAVVKHHPQKVDPLKKNIHKWRNVDSTKKQTFKYKSLKTSDDLQLTDPNVLLSKFKPPTNHSNNINCEASSPPSDIDCLNSKNVTSEKTSRFTWHKKNNSQISNVIALTYPKKSYKHENIVKVSTSKYHYQKWKTIEKIPVNSSARKSLKIKKLILGKYLRYRNFWSGDSSKNPYKVAKRGFPTFSMNRSLSRRSAFNQSGPPVSRFQSFASRRMCTNRREKYKLKKYGSKPSRFKFVRPRVQTRSRTSGNIVLKRKQQPVRGSSNRFSAFARPLTVQQRLASSVIHRSLETARLRNQHKIKKVYCIFYNRFGKCNRGGECPYAHDPRRVAVCTRFLRGTCRNEACPFSHKTSKAKMPLCSFFLRGKCSAKNCPYLHVFHGPDAVVCRSFAETGYCSKAAECKDLHLRVCPTFYQFAQCKGKCNLPHRRKAIRKRNPVLVQSGATQHTNEKSQIQLLPEKSLSEKSSTTVNKTLTSETSNMRIQPRLKNRKLQENI